MNRKNMKKKMKEIESELLKKSNREINKLLDDFSDVLEMSWKHLVLFGSVELRYNKKGKLCTVNPFTRKPDK